MTDPQPTIHKTPQGQFLRCNLFTLAQQAVNAHDGQGEVLFTRMIQAGDVQADCNFMDFTTVPPGTSIGQHSHTLHEEEYYLILSGTGEMLCNGQHFPVTAGDFVRNPPGGTHALHNPGPDPLQLFVFELGANRS